MRIAKMLRPARQIADGRKAIDLIVVELDLERLLDAHHEGRMSERVPAADVARHGRLGDLVARKAERRFDDGGDLLQHGGVIRRRTGADRLIAQRRDVLLAILLAADLSARRFDHPAGVDDPDVLHLDVGAVVDGLADLPGDLGLALGLSLRDDHQLFGGGRRVEHAERDGAAGLDARHVRDDLLDLVRVEVAPVDDHEVVGAAEHVELALVHEAEIAGAVAPRFKTLLRQFGAAVVAVEQERRLHHDLADMALADRGSVLHHRHLDAVERLAGAQQQDPAVFGRPRRAVAMQRLAIRQKPFHRPSDLGLADGEDGLRHGVADLQLPGPDAKAREPLLEPVEGLRLAGFGAVDDGLDVGEIGREIGRNGPRHVLVGEIGQPREGALVGLERLEHRGRPRHPVERVENGDGLAHHQRNDRARDQSHVVIERQPGDDGVVLGRAELGHVALGLGEDRAMGQRDALLERRRPGGMLQKRDVVRTDVGHVEAHDVARLGDVLDRKDRRAVVGEPVLGHRRAMTCLRQQRSGPDQLEQRLMAWPVDRRMLLGRGERHERRHGADHHRSDIGRERVGRGRKEDQHDVVGFDAAVLQEARECSRAAPERLEAQFLDAILEQMAGEDPIRALIDMTRQRFNKGTGHSTSPDRIS